MWIKSRCVEVDDDEEEEEEDFSRRTATTLEALNRALLPREQR